jgi:arylsulfatase
VALSGQRGTQFLETFKEYPPSQVSGSNSVTRFLEAIQNGVAGGGK